MGSPKKKNQITEDLNPSQVARNETSCARRWVNERKDLKK
jgi:hypothetical protein